MRTARDAINRILHDPRMDAEEYVVGYLDRFEGVLEMPLTAFDWKFRDADPDAVSIPQHRIRYIARHGELVWDREQRVDLVFGSVHHTP